MLYSGVGFIATLLKVIHNICQGKLDFTFRRLHRKSKCLLLMLIQFIETIHFTLFVASFSSFVTTMLAGECHFENGISGFVSAPTATISLLSLVTDLDTEEHHTKE